ncbi:MAG: late competence protein ComER [Methanosaeta sp. PtaU1.Bin112]|nr:MAG: late competence protein ComER [Methanosaeta sp. PtaU1.Bin112]
MTAFGFIGTGHLGSMLIENFVETQAVEPEDILTSNRTQEKDFAVRADMTGCAPSYFAALMRKLVLAAERKEIKPVIFFIFQISCRIIGKV